jgi:hypothetical protein
MRTRPDRPGRSTAGALSALLTTLALSTPLWAQSWTGPSFREFSGVNQDGTSDSLFTSALGWDRQDVDWPDTESASGVWNSSYLGSVESEVSGWNSAGVSFLPILDYTPNWAADKSARSWTNGNEKWSVAPNGDGTFTFDYYTLSGSTWTLNSTWQDPGTDLHTWPPANTSDWTAYITHVVNALHASPYNVNYFQIWNEASNHSGFWTGSMADYMNKVHLPAASAIHAAGGKVVYGGWPDVQSINDLISLLDTYNAWGSLDAIDTHYFNVWDMSTLRQAADSRGYTNLGVWQTEVGFTTLPNYIANNYPRTLFWALNNNWSTPDKYKLMYFADWAPDDPAAYGYHCCLYSGSSLSSHGQILQNLSSLLGGGHLSAYPGVTSSLASVTQANATDVTASALESFVAGQNIVVAVHLTASDYSGHSSITLTLPIAKSLVTSARRVDLSGTSVTLTGSLTGGSTSTSLSVATHDASGSSANTWNTATSSPRTFYVVFGTSPIANGTYTLSPACATSSALDADNWGTANGTKVQIWGWSNGTNQKWVFTNMGNGQYKIQPSYSTSVALDVTGASLTDGTATQLYTDNGTGAQRWYISPAGAAGYYTLMPACAGGSCLDVTGSSSTDGTVVDVYHWNGTTAQMWKIAP